MVVLLRIAGNIAVFFMAVELVCSSMPALILTSHVVHGVAWYAIVGAVGLVDIALTVFLFIVMNMLLRKRRG